MSKVRVVALASFLLSAVAPVGAADMATPEEVIARVNQAVAYLAKEGAGGLPTFNLAESAYVGKGTYVFVFDCNADRIVAHPVKTSQGLKISMLIGADGDTFGDDMCAASKKPFGGWTEYKWEKPIAGKDGALDYTDETYRKVSFMMSVPGQPYQVGAGIYVNNLTVADLDKLAAK